MSARTLIPSELLHLSCSFCGKQKPDVDVLIAGPAVYICNECVTLAEWLVADVRNRRRKAKAEAIANLESKSS